MTAVYNDSFFDSDGEHDNHKADSPYLKGEYDRGNSSPITETGEQRATKNKSQTPSTSGNFSAKSSDSIMSEKRGTKSNRYNDSPSRSRSRSRSPSPYRSPYTRSPAYSDSFNSEDSEQDSRRASPQRTRRSVKHEASTKPKAKARGGYSSTSSNRFNSGTSQDSRSTFKSYGGSSNYSKTSNRPKKAFQKTPVKKPAAANNTTNKRSNSIASNQTSPRNTNEVTRRMLSAKGHTISRLRNEFNQLQKDHDEVVRENKLLKTLQCRQERALARLDSEESELPQLLKKHSAELDSMRRRIRKYQERDRDRDRRMKDKDEQLVRTEDELKHIKTVAEDKGLLERHDLQKRVSRLKDKLEGRDKKLGEMERYVEHMKKNQRRELHERQGREEELKGQMASLEMENERLQMQIREREKELEVRNIYSNRLIKPPGKLRHNLSPTSLKPIMLSKATSTADQPKLPHPPQPDRQQRERSAEEVRRREETAARIKSPKDALSKKEATTEPEKSKWEEPSKELSEHEKILRDLDMGWGERDGGDARQKQEDERWRQQEEQELRKKREEERQQELEEKLRREKEERWRRQEEAAAKRKLEEEEKEKERKKKEALQESSYSPNFDNSPGDDEDNIPFFGSKPTETHKPPSTKSPPYAVNSVRDLHKYSRGDNDDLPKQGQDEGGRFGQTHVNDADQDKEAERLAEERHKKDLLLARMREIDDGKTPDSGRSHKNYNFTKPVENLHNGIPSHPDPAGNGKGKKEDAMTFGSYAPTFSSGKAPQKQKKSFFDDDDGDVFSKPKPAASQEPDKKSNLMADLFGNNTSEEKAAKSSFNDDKNMFTSSTKAKPILYPWEKKVDVGRGTNATNPGATNGFNGKSASKAPGNMSHDSLDDIDDLEEVIL